MSESRKTRFQRLLFNLFPAYRGTGARVTYIRHDRKEIHIRLPLNWKTRNYVGTIFGGSMFAAADPIYMIMLINTLGKDYIVWDKSGEIKFRRPGKEQLYARFILNDKTIEEIKEAVKKDHEVDYNFAMEYTTKSGKVISEITKKIYIADKSYYNQKRSK